MNSISHSMWTYGIQLWGCAKPSHTQILQRFQSKILRSLADALWYVSNLQLHSDLRIPFVAAEISRSSLLYHRRLTGHHNPPRRCPIYAPQHRPAARASMAI